VSARTQSHRYGWYAERVFGFGGSLSMAQSGVGVGSVRHVIDARASPDLFFLVVKEFADHLFIFGRSGDFEECCRRDLAHSADTSVLLSPRLW
jgi:hypothetical protein